MTVNDDLAMVIELACENSWRDDAEQRALLRLADKVDRERSKLTTTNKQWVAPYLEAHVDQTRRLDDDQQVITLPSVVRARKRVKR